MPAVRRALSLLLAVVLADELVSARPQDGRRPILQVPRFELRQATRKSRSSNVAPLRHPLGQSLPGVYTGSGLVIAATVASALWQRGVRPWRRSASLVASRERSEVAIVSPAALDGSVAQQLLATLRNSLSVTGAGNGITDRILPGALNGWTDANAADDNAAAPGAFLLAAESDRQAALAIAMVDFVRSPTCARLRELRQLARASQPLPLAPAVRAATSSVALRLERNRLAQVDGSRSRLAFESSIAAKDSQAGLLLLLVQALLQGPLAEMEAANIRVRFGLAAEADRAERCLLSATSRIVASLMAEKLPRSTAAWAQDFAVREEGEEPIELLRGAEPVLSPLRKSMAQLVPLLGTEPNQLRPLLLREVMPHVRALLESALATWLAEAPGPDRREFIGQRWYSLASAAAELALCSLDCGGSADIGALEEWHKLAATLPSARLVTLARHEFHDAYLRSFASEFVHRFGSRLESEGSRALRLRADVRPAAMARLLGSLPSGVKKGGTAAFQQAVQRAEPRAATTRIGPQADGAEELGSQLLHAELLRLASILRLDGQEARTILLSSRPT